MQPILLQSVRLLNPLSAYDGVMDLFIDPNGTLLPKPPSLPDCRIVDGRDCIATPGLLDMHVHFRDPGITEAETLQTGAQAAAAGGFTRVVTMPNTLPACDSPEIIYHQQRNDLPVRILPSAAITVDRAGKQLADLPHLAEAGAVAFTDDGAMVHDSSLMRQALVQAHTLGKLVMDHAVLPDIAGKGVIRDCRIARQNGIPIFSPQAEVDAVRQDIRLAEESGGHIHIQHLSCAESVELIRQAQRKGICVTAEVTPHHLSISCEQIPANDGNWRMAPPLGTKEDVRALRQGIKDGTIQAFATDHAPHAPARKNLPYAQAASGIIGLETAAAITWQAMVEPGELPPLRWAALWTTAPATLLGVAPPALRFGAPADLALFRKTVWHYHTKSGFSKSRNTPFGGMTFPLRVELTFMDGRKTYDRYEHI
ncbi:MAG: dihydroorotase [Kiritimatiellia bacterium]|nr:dihydroorotase [Kiritimatiellia bacterium]